MATNDTKGHQMDNHANHNHNEPDLNALAELWVMHKEVENGARDARIDVEQRLMPFLETKEEGSKTVNTKHRKITVKTGFTRTLDGTALNKIRKNLTEEMLPLTVKEVLDEKRLRHYQLNEPDFYREFSRAFTTKPSKPNFKIVPLEQK